MIWHDLGVAQIMRPLPQSFFERDTVQVAQALLGCLLVRAEDGGPSGRRLKVARIVETEAYVGPHDLACHASKGLTPRTEVLHGPPGRAYVYFVYGMHHLLNVVTEVEGFGAGVLFRGIEPLEGFEPGVRTDGPAKLTKVLGIGKEFNRWDLTLGEELWLARGERPDEPICRGPRIGVDYAGPWAEAPLRFWISGNEWVSRPRRVEKVVLQGTATRKLRKSP